MTAGTDPSAPLLDHAAFVRAVARGALGRDDLVDDVTQETWLAEMQSASPPAPGRRRGWLGSIAYRRAKDAQRTASRRRVHESAVAASTSPISSARDAAEVVAQAELGRRVAAAVLALPEPYREALLLRYHEDLTPREVAERLGVPVETARTRIKRGLAQLRLVLDTEEDGNRRRWALPLAAWLGMAPPPVPRPQWHQYRKLIWPTTVAILLFGALVFSMFDSPGSAGVANGNTANAGNAAENRSTAADTSTSRRTRGARGIRGGAGSKSGTTASGDAVAEEGAAAPAVAEETHTLAGIVVDRSGAPVPGVPIRFTHWAAVETPDGEESEAEGFDLNASTDTAGRFSFVGLPPNEWSLSLPSEDGYSADAKRRGRLPAAEELRLEVLGSLVIGGRVDGPDVGDVHLDLMRRDMISSDGWSRGYGRETTLTGPDLAFQFTALRPGTYELTATTPDGRSAQTTIVLAGSVTDTKLTIPLMHALRVRVTWPEEWVDAFAMFWIFPLGSDDHLATKAAVKRGVEFTTGSHPYGTYRGFIRVEPRDEDGAALLIDRAFELVLDGTDRVIDFVVEPEETIGLVVVPPEPGVSVEGTAWVVGGAAEPEEDHEFTASVDEQGNATTEVRRLRFDLVGQTPDGALRLRGLLRGASATLRVEVPGYETVERPIEVTGPATIRVPIVRRKGRTLDITDMPGVVRYHRLEARRTDEAAPDIGWTTLIDYRNPMVSHSAPAPYSAFVAPGTYTLRLVTDEHTPRVVEGLVVTDEAESLALPFDFDGSLGTRVHGVVRTHEGGPPADVSVYILRQNEGTETWTELVEKRGLADEGKFLFRGLTRGRYRIALAADGRGRIDEFLVDGTAATMKREIVIDR